MAETKLTTTIAIIGGTGKEGKGLAVRWADAGYPVIIGSRSEERAQDTADEINEMLNTNKVSGLENQGAANAADIIVVSVPYSALRNTLERIQDESAGKIVIDVTVPLKPPVNEVQIPEDGSAAEQTQAILGDEAIVVSAFQNVSYTLLMDPAEEVDCDVLVTGDDTAGKQMVLKLIGAIGLRGIDAGPLANAVIAESLTSALIHINKQYGIKHAGIRITGIE